MSNEKKFWVGIKALIEDEQGRILLMYAPGWPQKKIEPHWDIPGGRIEQGMSVEATLMREIGEETGITKIESSEFFSGVISNHNIDFGHEIIGLVLMIYKVKIPANSRIKLSDEHTKYEWTEPKDAAKRLAHKYPPEFTSLL